MKFFSLTCHQRYDRSFFYKEYQFPLCARCTGMLLGYIGYIILLPIVGVAKVKINIIFLTIMFLDWFIQFLQIKESNNIRRLITGIFGGYGAIGVFINMVGYLLIKIHIL